MSENVTYTEQEKETLRNYVHTQYLLRHEIESCTTRMAITNDEQELATAYQQLTLHAADLYNNHLIFLRTLKKDTP